MPRMRFQENGVSEKLYDAIDRAPGGRAIRGDLDCFLRPSAHIGPMDPIREGANQTLLISHIYTLTMGGAIRRTRSVSFYSR